MKLDRISNLPSDLIEKILSRLPIPDAARTSVLSSNWRYQFAMLPNLVFNYRCISIIVDRVLFSHIGPITKFCLVQGFFMDIEDIDRWVLHLLSRYSLQELILRISPWQVQRYKMPSFIFSCQDTTLLKSSRCCLLKPPSTFQGIKSLKSLEFVKVMVDQDVLEHLIVCSPHLERLTLKDCDGFSRVKIDGYNLRFLDIEGAFEDISFSNTVNVADVSIRFEKKGVHRSCSKVIQFLDDLPSLRISWFRFKKYDFGPTYTY